MEKTIDELKSALQKFLSIKPEILNSIAADAAQEITGKDSPMKMKIRNLMDFLETDMQSGKLFRTATVKTQKELMMDLGEKEAADYYKYLRLPQTRLLDREEQISSISMELLKHPEYFLYVFDKEEYTEMREILKTPEGELCYLEEESSAAVKAIGLGLADFSRKGKDGEICLASDIKEYIDVLDERTIKKTYQMLEKFDMQLGKLIQLYGIVELESLYNIYRNAYKDNTEKKNFFRMVYWHARFNDFLETVYRVNGTCYVASKDLDVVKVLERTEMYADKLFYREYSAMEIDFLTEDMSNRSEWMDYFFVALRDLFGMQNSEALACLESIVDTIIEGDTLDFVLAEIEEENQHKYSVESAVELWKDVAGIMLDMELPMLKGRCRRQYAEEQKVSPWSVGMISDVYDFENSKKRHIYQFPVEIQEELYAEDGNEDVQIQQLFEYKEQNKICSEEFIYLLAEKCLMNDQMKQAETLIYELMLSSPEGKNAAKFLKKIAGELKKRDGSEEIPEELAWNWMGYENAQKPYIRSNPKIGRNDPCPCGSGKKYKKCCGR